MTATHYAMIALRLIHILSAIFWVGTMAFNTFFLFPVLASVGRSAVPVMAGLGDRGMLKAMPAAAGLTILSGLSMVWVASGGNVSAYAQTNIGRGFTGAGGIAIVAFIVGMVVQRPAMLKGMALGKEAMGMAAGPEKEAKQAAASAAQKRAGMAMTFVTVLLILAAAGMAVSRYL